MWISWITWLRLCPRLGEPVEPETAEQHEGDRKVRAFDRDDGDEAWETVFDRPTSSAPTIAGNRVYIGVRGSQVVTESGELSDPPLLVCLSAADGSKLWEMEVDGNILSAPIISGDKMMFGTDQNYFYVLEEVL